MKRQLLVLHGALGSKSQFEFVKQELGQNYEVYTLNFEGHGGRSSNKPFSIALFTDNVISFLDRENIMKVSIFGYSMGGYVALNVALLEPNRIQNIITLGTKFNWSIASAQNEVTMLNPEKIEEKVPRFAERLNALHTPLDWKQVMTKTANMMMDMANGEKLNDDDFRKINADVVIGLGDLDTMVTLEESLHVSELLPNARLVKLDEVQHPIDKIYTKQLVTFITNGLQ